MTGEFYDKCLTCIGGFKEQGFVRNGLVALEAGCQQRPAPGKTIGISGSIFSPDHITILNPQSDGKDGKGSGTPTTTIVIAVISGVIGLAAVAAIVYMCIRKRRNRKERAGSGRGGDHRRQSSLSFWCPTPRNHNPLQMFAGPGGDSYSNTDGVSPYDDAAAQAHRQQQDQQQKSQHIVSVRGGATPTPPVNLWRTSHAVTTPLSPVNEDKKSNQGWSPSSPRQDWSPTPGLGHDTKDQTMASDNSALGYGAGDMGLHQLKTSLPTPPRNAHASPLTASTTTPTSATQLLSYAHAPYVPADHPPVAGSPKSPRLPRRQSPASSPQQQWGWPAPAMPPSQGGLTRSVTASPPPPSKSPRIGAGGRRGGRDNASPVESNAIQTSFPGPPRR